MRDPARILVVDDIADNVEILRMRLDSLGYEVVVAEDGEQALARVRETLPDLILLDIMMPKIDGHGGGEAAESRCRACPSSR